MISKSCKYAIRAAIFIASKVEGKDKLSVKEIASEIEAPGAFTAKILQTLNKANVVTSLKGPYGGFFCVKHQLDLPVIEIVKAVDGLAVFRDCVLGLHQCSDDHPCPMHFQYAATRDSLRQTFEKTTLGQLVEDYRSGNSFLTNS